MSVSSATVYLQARQRIEANKGDDRDEVIVAMWNLNSGLVAELQSCRSVISQQQTALDSAARQIANDTFDSHGMIRNAVMGTKLPDVAHVQH